MQKHERTVLIYEEDAEVSQRLELAAKSLGYSVHSVADGDEVLAFLRTSDFMISGLLLGVTSPNRGGLDLVREIRTMDARLPIIVIAGKWSTRDVVAALKTGVTDLLCRPVIHGELVAILVDAMGNSNAPAKSAPSRNGVSSWTFRSANAGIKEMESKVGKIGWSGAPVLIQGETGSGKEVLARRLHAQSARADKPFLKLNCAALPSELVESELFGYERGAFTGAFEKKAGIFELADGGTILLDEIGDMDFKLQAKLLQVLQDQEFRRIGGKESVKVNVRIIAATHRDLEKAIADNSFREDLYYRLNVIVLQVPPLRERPEDIVPLGEFLIKKHADQNGPLPAISLSLQNAMTQYKWPGNVRELENYMRKLTIFLDPDALASDLAARVARRTPVSIRPSGGPVALVERPDDVSILQQVTKEKRQAETDAILAALASTRWNRKQAAGILDIDYKSLLYKMKKLGIDDASASLPERSQPLQKRAASGD